MTLEFRDQRDKTVLYIEKIIQAAWLARQLARQLASYIRSPISLGQGSCDATALAVLVH